MFFSVFGCGEKPPIIIWKTASGKEYKILKTGELYFKDGRKMLTVRFKSENVENPKLRNKEFQDIYLLVAQNLKLENFTHVGLEAVPQGEPNFGCQQFTGYRDNKTVDEIKELVGGV